MRSGLRPRHPISGHAETAHSNPTWVRVRQTRGTSAGLGELDDDGVASVLGDGVPASAGGSFGQRTVRVVQSVWKLLLAKPSAALACGEWPAISEVTMVMLFFAAAVTGSAGAAGIQAGPAGGKAAPGEPQTVSLITTPLPRCQSGSTGGHRLV